MDITKTELPGGLLGSLDSNNRYMVIANGDGQDGLVAFGDSLKEAQVNYWRKKIADTEPLFIESTKRYTELSSEVKTLLDAWETANAVVLEATSEAAQVTDSSEKLLKQAATSLFALTGEKEPGEYVAVKEKDGGLTYDKKAAIEWCRENMKAAIIEELNTKAFESYAKDAELDFVTKNDKIPQAQIARKKVEEAVNAG